LVLALNDTECNVHCEYVGNNSSTRVSLLEFRRNDTAIFFVINAVTIRIIVNKDKY